MKARSKLKKGQCERDVGESLGEKKMSDFCQCSCLKRDFSLKQQSLA